jgi:hypothetical protein
MYLMQHTLHHRTVAEKKQELLCRVPGRKVGNREEGDEAPEPFDQA